jgi:hypothetical protein
MITTTHAQPEQTYCFTHKLPNSIGDDKEFAQSMHYRVQKVGDQKVLLAIGGIEDGEAGRLQQALERFGPIDEVWLNSPGGDAEEGPLMGRLLHKLGLVTRLPKGYACISACSYAFLGGVIRIVDPGSYYGIHMFTTTRNPDRMLGIMNDMAELASTRQQLLKEKKYTPESIDRVVADKVGQKMRDIEQRSAKIAAIRARYLVEMSLSLAFMTDAFGQDADGVCFLSPAGLARYNVSNSR